jgi:hypothetical protein
VSSRLSFEYSIKRARRKTLGLYVKDGLVEVRTPYFVNHADIHQWVAEKAGWVEERLLEAQQKAEEKPDISHGGEILFLGKPRQLQLTAGQPAINEENEAIVITHRSNTNIHALLEKWLKEEARLYLTERIGEIAETMQETGNIHGIQFRKTRSKWGHCTSKGILQFNWLIIMAPTEVIDYLIIHEISHLQQMNHSPAFWQRVSQFCPDYKTPRHWLKENGHRLWF